MVGKPKKKIWRSKGRVQKGIRPTLYDSREMSRQESFLQRFGNGSHHTDRSTGTHVGAASILPQSLVTDTPRKLGASLCRSCGKADAAKFSVVITRERTGAPWYSKHSLDPASYVTLAERNTIAAFRVAIG